MFKAGSKCFRSCDNEVLVMLIPVYGIVGWDAWSGTGPSLGPALGFRPAAEETIALMSRVLAVVVPGAGVATGQCRGSVGGDLEWSCPSHQLVTAPLRSPAFRVSTQ